MTRKNERRLAGGFAILGGIVVGGFGSPEPSLTIWPTVYWLTMFPFIGMGIYLLVRSLTLFFLYCTLLPEFTKLICW